MSFPKINEYSNKEMENFLYYLIRYMETTFSKNATHEANFDEKSLLISFEDYIVCRNNGYGYILTDGGSAGLWSYLMQDKSIEGVQLNCQGRGNNRCDILCAPFGKLVENIKKVNIELNLPDKQFDESYKIMNEIRPSNYSKNSMKDLIDNNFFRYDEGSFFYKENRFFGCESHILYLLEEEISKLDYGEKIIFDTCFEYGKALRRIYSSTDYKRFITDFFPALGFGDITFLSDDKPVIASIFYPWTTHSEKSKYLVFRGLMSGFITDAIGNNIIFDDYEIDIDNYLTLTIKSNS